MPRPFAVLPFSPGMHYRVVVGGKKKRICEEDCRALQLLKQFDPSRADGIGWMLPLRDQIREIQRVCPRTGLILVVERTKDEEVRRIAIWLLGRCGGTAGAAVVAAYANSIDSRVCKEVVRALHRLSAWAELRKLEESEDPRLRRLAAQRPTRPYATRLAAFSAHTVRVAVGPSHTSLLVSPEVDLTQRCPPKPSWFIRLILERIRRLVGETSR